MKKILVSSMIAMLLLIWGFHYKLNFDLRIEPPSTVWSKEVSIGKGKVKNFPKIIERNKKYIVAFIDGTNIQVITTDQLGVKLSTKTIDTKGSFIKSVNLLQNDTQLFLAWVSNSKGVNHLTIAELDEGFNVKELKEVNNILEVAQVEDNMLAISHADKIELWDIQNNKHVYVPEKDTSLISGVLTERGYLFSYLKGEEKFNYFFLKDGIVTQPKLAATMYKSEKVVYLNAATSADSKNGYIILEQQYGGESYQARYIRFDFEGGQPETKTLYVDGSKEISNLVGASSKEGARFLGTFTRIYGTKTEQKDIIDFILTSNQVKEYDIVSRTRQLSIYPAVVGDAVVYCDFVAGDVFEIFMGSRGEEFKATYDNEVRSQEKKQAWQDTLQGLFYSFAYILIYAIKWIFPALTISGIVSFFDYSFREKKKKISFTLVVVATVLLKTWVVLDVSYNRYYAFMPKILASKILGIGICILFGLIAYGYSYLRYTEDLEAIPVLRFIPGLAIDTMLTLMLFVPLMV